MKIEGSDVELKPWQADAVRKMKNGCILKGRVGSGKTYAALAYYVLNESPKDLYVITTARKRDEHDWERDALHFTIGNAGGGGHGVLFTDSWNNIQKYKTVTGAFFIFDEQRLVGHGAWVRSFLEIAKKNSWIMLSATPGDSWMDYVPVFIANGFYKNRTEFTRQHVVYSYYGSYPRIERFVGTGTLGKHRREILVEMPDQRLTKRHVEIVPVDFDRDAFSKVWKKRWNIYEEKPIKETGALFYLLRRVLNSSPSRLEALSTLIKKHSKSIVFYNFDYELDILTQFLTEQGITFSEWNGHKHQPIPTSKEWVYLVQYQSGAEAWNCTETDTVVLWSLNYSYRITEQAMGRIDRMNTSFVDLWYYYLVSESWLDRAIIRALSKKQDFNEGKLLREGV